MSSPEQMVNVRYMVDDVQAAIDFYTSHLGFTLRSSAAPAFADVTRGNLRLLLAGPASSAGRPMPDGAKPGPGGWNRIHFIVPDIGSEVARLRAEGVSFRNEIVTGPGGKQILVADRPGTWLSCSNPRPVPRLARDPAGPVHQGESVRPPRPPVARDVISQSMSYGWRIRHSRETRRNTSRELPDCCGTVVTVSPVVADVATQVPSARRCDGSRVGNGELPDGVRRGRGRVLDGCR